MFFSFVMIMFQMVFVCVCAVILFLIVKNISTWNKNNHSPTSTSYYVTFQVESGDRMELRVSRSEYGLLAERNQGNLSFQGTRYLGFEITS